jgi:3D (Asp-Asp-Asp) domain-containing protein
MDFTAAGIARVGEAQFTGAEDVTLPASGANLRFTATAYCKGTTTASGVNVRTGIAAADPSLLPVGSVIQVYKLGERYNGIYTIMDTGPAVQGRHIDIYMWSCNEALELERRAIAINLLRLGWNPKASTPTLIGGCSASAAAQLDNLRFRCRRDRSRFDSPQARPSGPQGDLRSAHHTA